MAFTLFLYHWNPAPALEQKIFQIKAVLDLGGKES